MLILTYPDFGNIVNLTSFSICSVSSFSTPGDESLPSCQGILGVVCYDLL